MCFIPYSSPKILEIVISQTSDLKNNITVKLVTRLNEKSGSSIVSLNHPFSFDNVCGFMDAGQLAVRVEL